MQYFVMNGVVVCCSRRHTVTHVPLRDLICGCAYIANVSMLAVGMRQMITAHSISTYATKSLFSYTLKYTQ